MARRTQQPNCHAGSVRRILAAVLAAVLVTALGTGSAKAQLSAADLKKVHAIMVNTVAWGVLRKAIVLGFGINGLGELAAAGDDSDTATAVLALEDPEGRLSPILSGATRGGILTAVNPITLARHGLDGPRPKGLSCLIYGSRPEDRAFFANIVEMPETERATCATHYPRIRDHWVKAAAPFLRSPGDPEQRVDVEWGEASGPLASARAALQVGETIEEVAAFLARTGKYGRPLVLRGTSCGAPRVDIDEANNRVIFCYELAAELATSLGRSLGG